MYRIWRNACKFIRSFLQIIITLPIKCGQNNEEIMEALMKEFEKKFIVVPSFQLHTSKLNMSAF